MDVRRGPQERRLDLSGSVAVVAALLALLWPAPAQGQGVTAEVLPARVFAGWLVYRNYTRVDQFVVWNAQPGSEVLFVCATRNARGRERGCVARRDWRLPRTLAFLRVPASGILDLTPYVRAARLRPARSGQPSLIGVFSPTRPRPLPAAYKDVSFFPRRGALPRRVRTCSVEIERDRVRRTPCATPCPPPPMLQFSNHCEGAGRLLPLPLFSVASRRARGGGVRITRLRVSGLPLEPPFSDPSVAVFCRGRGCPFGARFFAAPPGGVLGVRSVGRRVLRPGTVIEVQVIKGNFIGRVQRYEVTARRLRASSRCLYPTQLRPQACPPA